ncbi:MAG: hypothetical protein ACI8W7_005121 [Gammaproteobacteria bacterium]|jgi:hypothetical protein
MPMSRCAPNRRLCESTQRSSRAHCLCPEKAFAETIDATIFFFELTGHKFLQAKHPLSAVKVACVGYPRVLMRQ